jgi:hypothetical protein
MAGSFLIRQIDERFDDVRRMVARHLDQERRTLAGGLVKGFRRLRGYRSEEEWISALLDSCAPFCTRCAVFTVNTGKLEWKAARNLESAAPIPPFAIEDAAAFAAAIDSREVTVTLCTTREISSTLTFAWGEDPSRKAALVPVIASTGNRVAAILYAEDAEPEGLELVCGIAGLALTAAPAKDTGIGLLQIAPAPAPAVQLLAEDEALHLRAQRLARKLAAEIRLHDSAAVLTGRAQADLYSTLGPRIDAARDTYRNQFLAGASTNHMPDFLHDEFVRVLAAGKPALLGPGYPSQPVAEDTE